MYGLEYFLFFGIPDGKTELIDGRSRWVFPFFERAEAEAHYELWLETLCRWKQIGGKPEVRKSPNLWEANFAGIEFELYPRPIRMTLPIEWQTFDAFFSTYYRRDFWPGQPRGLETGRDSWMDWGDIRMRLWSLLRAMTKRHGGTWGNRTDIAISDTAGVSPTAYYYRPGRENIMIEDDYFRTPPDLIAETLMAASRQLDRGERMELYRRCGVPHLWLLEPTYETVEVYELHAQYKLVGTFGPGATFSSPLFPGEQIVVDQLFDTQSMHRPGWAATDDSHDHPAPIPEWLLPAEMKLGLEYFFLLGHPQRRWEFWNNKAHSMLAFGSAKEAQARLQHFAREAANWEGVSNVKISSLSPDADQAEVGRFQLTRQGRVVRLDIAVDGRRYQELLGTWGKREAWDWGEEE